MMLVRHFRCAIANTASITGSVTSAVRDTTTNTMLMTKFAATAVSNSAWRIFPSRNSVMMGKASTTTHSTNSWLCEMQFLTKMPCPVGSPGVFSEILGSITTIQDATVINVQETRNATNTHMPRAERSK